MGGRDWAKVVTKAKKSIDDLADKLVEIYAQREITEALHFCQINHGSKSLKMHSHHERRKINYKLRRKLKNLLERPVPMDRLLAGDVGFGKTEVAMRAIFKAVMSGKQVAVLVPTTVLAQQHFQPS